MAGFAVETAVDCAADRAALAFSIRLAVKFVNAIRPIMIIANPPPAITE
jgi:hypothetical protein